MKDLKQAGALIYDQWTALWNNNSTLAEIILAPELSLHYAQPGTEAFDNIKTPEQLAEMIRNWHLNRPGIIFQTQGEAVVDLDENEGGVFGFVARPYGVSFNDNNGNKITVSGTDILKIVSGRIQEVWSVSGGPQGRSFYPEKE